MDTRTGVIVDESSIPEEDKHHYVSLTNQQVKKYHKLKPSERMGQFRLDQDKHRDRQIAKRRAANKRNNQARKGK